MCICSINIRNVIRFYRRFSWHTDITSILYMKCSVNPNSVVYMYIVYNIVHMHKHLDCCIHSINNRSFQHNSLLFVYKHFSRSWEKYLKKNILIFNSTLAKVEKKTNKNNKIWNLRFNMYWASIYTSFETK